MSPESLYCLVGVAKDYRLNPRQVGGGFIYAYKVNSRVLPQQPHAPFLELVHKTTLDEIPYSMCPFQGRVLIGVGKLLRLYDIGKKKLLRKSENKVSLKPFLHHFSMYLIVWEFLFRFSTFLIWWWTLSAWATASSCRTCRRACTS